MRPQIKIFLLLALVLLMITILVVASGLIFSTNDNTYLTPIPESTWSAYRGNMPINSKLDAVIAARAQLATTRLQFTKGEPKPILAEKMTLSESKERVPKDPSEVYSYEDRPENTKVWLIVFEGQWQILPPGSNDLLPLEAGCIYVTIDIEHEARTAIFATKDCIP
ncbi:MAG TPA: hypothetical protein VK206_15020 [Anaerolineales bacterium]|nr:hypothetical protein [Anaerolineales bacterium]